MKNFKGQAIHSGKFCDSPKNFDNASNRTSIHYIDCHKDGSKFFHPKVFIHFPPSIVTSSSAASIVMLSM
jgi:hypothetical protein